MKKLSILGVLVVAVIVTAYSVSGTYARYVSSVDAATGDAIVATWDVDSVNTVDDIFSGITFAPGANGNFNIQIKNDSEVPAIITGLDVTPVVTNDIKEDGTTCNTNEVCLGLADKIQYAIRKVGSTDELVYGAADDLTISSAEKIAVGATSDEYTIYWKWVDSNTTEENVKDTLYGTSAQTKNIKLSLDVKVVVSQFITE